MQTIVGALVDLIPVAGGALIGILGGLVGTSYANRLSARSTQGAERRAKLELLVVAAYEIDVWLKKQENYYLFGCPEPLESSPIATIEGLGKMYFPSLDASVGALSKANVGYRYWLIEGAKLRQAENPRVLPKGYTDGIAGVYKPMIEARDELLISARTLMQTLCAP